VTVFAINSRNLEDIYDAIRNLGQIVRKGAHAEEVVTPNGARFTTRPRQRRASSEGLF